MRGPGIDVGSGDGDTIHLIGIGGEGMSGLARLLWEMGYRVSGSEIRWGRKAAELALLGIKVWLGHREENLTLAGARAVVFSSAIPPENVELAAARELGLPVIPRLEMLARLMEGRFSIGVAGTHGKSTTTAMLAYLLERGGREPAFLVGASSPALGGNARLGRGRYLVAEIDESDGRFVHLRPDLGVITNISADHLNTYGSEEALYLAFQRFARGCGQLILNSDDPQSARLLEQLEAERGQEQGRGREGERVLRFGIDRAEEADLAARRIAYHELHTEFELVFRGRRAGRVELPAPGKHNVYNALAALLAGWAVGLDFPQMAGALREFALPERRFQVLRQDGITVVDDYAHLPEEIEANLAAIRRGWRPRRVIAIFQPHRFTRVKYINGQFAHSFDLADMVIVTDIYPAFEAPIPGVEAAQIVRSLEQRGKCSVSYIPDKGEIIRFLLEHLQPGDFIIGFGAGDIWQVTRRLAEL